MRRNISATCATNCCKTKTPGTQHCNIFFRPFKGGDVAHVALGDGHVCEKGFME